MHVGLSGLRDEMHVGLSGLRDETHTELGTLRGEITGLRHDMASMRGEIRVEIAKIPLELVKWLIALAGIAAAIATTIYNVWFR
jgi:hypothetical protein